MPRVVVSMGDAPHHSSHFWRRAGVCFHLHQHRGAHPRCPCDTLSPRRGSGNERFKNDLVHVEKVGVTVTMLALTLLRCSQQLGRSVCTLDKQLDGTETSCSKVGHVGFIAQSTRG